MADIPEAPTPPAGDGEKPVRRRITRRAPAGDLKVAPGEAKVARGRPAKTNVASVEASQPTKTEAGTAEHKPKPRGTKRAAPAAKQRKSTRRNTVKPTAERLSERARGRWGAAAIAGGLAATGAVVAALFSVRGSTPKGKATKGVPALTSGADVPVPTAASEHSKHKHANFDAAKHNGAHQADGADASRSFAANIADEGTIPD